MSNHLLSDDIEREDHEKKENNDKSSSILLRRPDRISLSYYYSSLSKQQHSLTIEHGAMQSPTEEDDDDANMIILSQLELIPAPNNGGDNHAEEDAVMMINLIKNNNNNEQQGCLSLSQQQYVNSCSLLKGSEQSVTFVKEGDIVEYACGLDLRRPRDVGVELDNNIMMKNGAADELLKRNGDTSSSVSSSSNDDVDTATNGATIISETEVSSTANGNVQDDKIASLRSTIMMMKSCCDTTVCVKTTTNPIPMLRQANVLFSKREIMNEISAIQMNNLKADARGGRDNDDAIIISCMDIGITFSQQNYDNDKLLIIGAISKGERSWFRSDGCAITEGDIVVAFNEYIVSRMTPQDVTSFIHDILCSPKTCHLSITTIAATSSSRRSSTATGWDTIRRAVVTAGGGTLVASGAILMATPLHPVGHAMAIGGVGILGTEYEGPRKVMTSVKERLNETRQSWNERMSLFRKASSTAAESISN